MKERLGYLTLLVTLSVPMFAQPKPVEVSVHHVNDRRNNGSFSQLNIALELPKVPSSQVAASRVLVHSAVDDSGASLVETDEGEPELEVNARGSMRSAGEEDTPFTLSFALKNPSRQSTKVKEVRGEIELFMPSRDPNSIAELTKFLPASGKALTHKALKANGIEIVMVSKAQIDAARKKIADAKRKEYQEIGYSGEDLENTVNSMMEYTLNVEASDVPVRIKDPNKRLQELEYIDPSGEVKRVYTRELHEDILSITSWGDPPGPDWKLRVKMKTPKNLVRHTFALRDVALP